MKSIRSEAMTSVWTGAKTAYRKEYNDSAWESTTNIWTASGDDSQKEQKMKKAMFMDDCNGEAARTYNKDRGYVLWRFTCPNCGASESCDTEKGLQCQHCAWAGGMADFSWRTHRR